jgi:hypothetical protein
MRRIRLRKNALATTNKTYFFLHNTLLLCPRRTNCTAFGLAPCLVKLKYGFVDYNLLRIFLFSNA